MIKILFVAINIFSFSGCINNQHKVDSIPSVKEKDSCSVIIQNFVYPKDLNTDTVFLCSERFEIGKSKSFNQLFKGQIEQNQTMYGGSVFNLILNNSKSAKIEFTKIGLSKFLPKTDSLTFSLSTFFYDGNFCILSYQAGTKLLYDTQNDLIMCFKRNLDYANFDNKSIYKIYLLDNQLMPLYSINKEENNQYICRQYYYDDKYPELYSKLCKSKTETKEFDKLQYNDIITIFKKLSLGKTDFIGKYETHLSAYFKKVPLWIEN